MNSGTKQKASPVSKGEDCETETGKEGNPRRFPAACEMRKDRKACGRGNPETKTSKGFSLSLRVTELAGKLLRKKT